MGAYRSKPITDKDSSDDSGKYVKCGASSMQGWRVTQEDAHNCIIEYDENTSFFAVYDGHGSHEVAEYCSRKLPEYLKNCASYKSGEYSKALKDAFLGFDATLVEPEVIKILKQIAKDENEETEENQNSGSEDEDIRNLYEEARMPLEEVMAKYQADGANPQIKKVPGVTPPSPYVVAKQGCKSKALSEAGSSKAGSSGGCSSSSLDLPENSSAQDGAVNSSGDGGKDLKSETAASEDKVEDEPPSTSKETNGKKVDDSEGEKNKDEDEHTSSGSESKTEGENSASGSESKTEGENSNEVKVENIKQEEDVEKDNSKDVKEIDSKNSKSEENVPNEKEVPDVEKNTKELPDKKLEVNGNLDTDKKEPHENGDVGSEETEEDEEEEDKIIKTLKGKGKAILKKLEFSKRQSARQRSVAILFRSLLAAHDADSESDEDEGDEWGVSVTKEDDEKEGATEEAEGEEEEETEDDEEGEEEEEEDEDEEQELDDDDDEVKGVLDPGVESGCTAVVALLHGRDLYVANAGDSRCVVSRAGEALDMSLDHKPEDPIEIQRIVAAGGYVSRDGRVKGGLNLSRAIGDHTYKRSENLPPEEQMITALPDIRTLSLDPKQDEFMILACDGIWNSMTSQEVVNFVRTRLQNEDKKLSTICEELFDFCLAPTTFRDESGCDNMTAVIVKFMPSLGDASSSDLPNTSLPNTTNKRPASPVEDGDSAAKRIKTEGE